MRTLILGPPGTGKTTYLLELARAALARGVAPERVGFVSFTRRAVAEARSRAAGDLALDEQALVHYRTLHSLAMAQLGVRPAELMQHADYRDLCRRLGVEYRGSIGLDDLGQFYRARGDLFVGLETYARLTNHDLFQVWEQTEHMLDVEWHELERFATTLRAYKQRKLRVDFTDLLERFIMANAAPELDLLLVDEAQDFSRLQWQAVEQIAARAHDTVIAGDDDQAIFRWSGADVDTFLNLEHDRMEALSQSYRLPAAVHALAASLAARIHRRYRKIFKPANRHGAVERAASLEDIPGLERGNWLVLVRSNYQIPEIVQYLRDCGYSYEAARASGDAAEVRAAYTFEALAAGRAVSADAAREMAQYIAADVKVPSGATITARDLPGVQFDRPWYIGLDALPVDDANYIRAARRRGENLRRPRILIRTIHEAKGTEADNVALFTDISMAAARAAELDPDSEVRVFYTGVTRARERLVIVEPQTPTSFEI